MEISALLDEDIYTVAIPVWERMAEGSNIINYALYSSQFSGDLKERIGREKFEMQCKKVTLLTSLGNAEPIACIRREEGVTVLFRLLSIKLKGEFIGQLRLSGFKDNFEVTDAQVY